MSDLDWEQPTDAIALNEELRDPPYEGSQINLVQPDGYIEDPRLVLREGAPLPEDLWRVSTYDPMFYVGLMAKWGFTVNAWRSIKDLPPQIKPYIPPRPVPVYIGIQNNLGSFQGKSAPEFRA
jgi:hypothetical protein